MSYRVNDPDSDSESFKLKFRDVLSDNSKTKNIIEQLEKLGCKVDIRHHLKQAVSGGLHRSSSTPKVLYSEQRKRDLDKYNHVNTFSINQQERERRETDCGTPL